MKKKKTKDAKLYAVVDLETTGGDARHGRVIEVGIYIFDGKKVIDSYDSLVNPGRPIPRFITQLTGISNEMVEDAPSFDEVIDKIDKITEGKIFVAHNVGFDYSFLRNEFKLLERRFIRKRLCTVRLTRRIFPDLRSYSLGKLCKQFDIMLEDRHRAFGDARATTALLKHLIQNDLQGDLEDSLKRYSREAILPPHLPREDYEDLPEEPGVYYFLDQNGKIIYIGKAKNLRDRVTSHFMDTEVSGKSRKFKSEIYNISYEMCGNELIALLLESSEIKHYWPKYNWSQKRPPNNWALRGYEDQLGYQRLVISKGRSPEAPKAIFNSYSEGWGFVHKMATEHGLCKKIVGLQKSNQACHPNKKGDCTGPCLEFKKPDEHNEKLNTAMNELSHSEGGFAVIGEGRTTEESSVVLVENGRYVGFGFFQNELQITDWAQFQDVIKPQKDNLDVQRIIRGYIERSRDRVISFKQEELV